MHQPQIVVVARDEGVESMGRGRERDLYESQREPTKSVGSVLEEIFAKLGLSPSSETPRAQQEDEG